MATKLSNVADIIMGQSPPGDTYNHVGDGLPFYQGVTDFTYRFPKPRVYCTAPTRVAVPGDILVSVRAPIGRINVANTKCAIGRGIAIVRPHSPNDARFLEFELRLQEHYWQTLESAGSVFGNATRKDLEDLELTWPEDAYVRIKIGDILGALDDKIELNRRMAATLEEMARAIFKSWFIDFDPVRAKAEGRPTNLPPEIDVLFPNSFEDSELGPIPAGWDCKPLSHLASLSKVQVNPSVAPDLVYAHYSIPAYDKGRLPSFEVGSGILSQKFAVPPGAILVSKLNPETPRVWLPFEASGNPPICSTEFLVLQPTLLSSQSFLYCLTLSDRFRVQLTSGVTGTSKSHQRAQPQVVMATSTVAAPVELVHSFTSVAGPMLQRALMTISQSHTLASLRDSLLPKLISGEITRPKPESTITPNIYKGE